MLSDDIPRILAKRPVRYVLVGGSGFLVNLLVFMLMARGLSLDVRIAEVIGRSSGGVVTFLGHRQWTFDPGDAGHQHSLGGQTSRYVVLNLVNLAISPWVVWGLAWLTGQQLLLAKLLTEAVMLVETYVLTALIFRKRQHDDA